MLRRAAFGLPVGAFAARASAPPAPAPLTKLVAEGDSITIAWRSYAERWAAANPEVPFANYAQEGAHATDLHSRLPGMMAAEDPSHLTLLIGANDIAVYATLQEYIDVVLAYVAAAKAIKPTLVVGVCGILPRKPDEHLPAKFHTWRLGFNAAMRAAVGAEIDFYVPLGDHPDFGTDAGTDLTVIFDGVHPSQEGHRILAEVYAAVMDGILAEATGSTLDTFELADTGGAINTAYYADTGPLTGLGVGRKVTATIAGAGGLTRGNTDSGGAFSATPREVMNGDVCVVEVVSGPAAETPYTAVLTADGKSSSFTVTTDGPGSLVTTYRSFSGPNPSWTIGSNPSFENTVEYFAGRNILAIFVQGWTDSKPSGLMLDGTPGILLAENMNDSGSRLILQFWAVDKASGGSGELSLATGNFLQSYGYVLWSTNAGAVLASSGSVLKTTFGPVNILPAQLPPIIRPAGGSILYMAICYPTDRSLSPIANCTEVADFDASQAGADIRYWAGERAFTGQPGITFPGDWADIQMLSIALQPA